MNLPATYSRYFKIVNDMVSQINNETLPLGVKIPSEAELSRRYKVNRYNVRKAITKLCNLGYIQSEQGKGSFVIKRPAQIPYVLSAQTSFSHNMKNSGKQHSNTLLNTSERVATAKETEYLQLVQGQKVYELEFIRSSDDVPVSVSNSVLPVELFPHLLDYIEDYQSLYKLIKEVYGFTPQRIRSEIEVIFPSYDDAVLLDMPEEVALLAVESVAKHPEGPLVEYCKSRIRADRNRFVIHFGMNKE